MQIEEAVGVDAEFGTRYGRDFGAAAGGDQYVIGAVLLAINLDSVAADETGEALDDGDLVLAQYVLVGLVDAADVGLAGLDQLGPAEVIEDYRVTILGELNLKLEALNAIKLRNNFLNSDALYVPYVYEEFCYPRLMVMERIYGIPVSDIAALKAQGTNFKLLAERGVELFFTHCVASSPVTAATLMDKFSSLAISMTFWAAANGFAAPILVMSFI